MPGFDGTGPRGLGPMTGGGWGNCALPLANANAGPLRPGANFIARRAGRGFRHRYYASGFSGWAPVAAGDESFSRGYFWGAGRAVSPQEETQLLKDRAQFLEEELKEIQHRIEALQQPADKKEQ